MSEPNSGNLVCVAGQRVRIVYQDGSAYPVHLEFGDPCYHGDPPQLQLETAHERSKGEDDEWAIARLREAATDNEALTVIVDAVAKSLRSHKSRLTSLEREKGVSDRADEHNRKLYFDTCRDRTQWRDRAEAAESRVRDLEEDAKRLRALLSPKPSDEEIAEIRKLAARRQQESPRG